MLKPGGLGHTLGMLISGGGVQVRRQIWLYGGCSYYGEGWGSFGTNIGYVNIVGGRGLGQSLGMLIFGGPCGGFGTDIGNVNIVGPGKGKGWGTDIGDVNIGGGGLGQKWVCPYYGGGVFWDRHWGC